jgi:FKBP-type peptidyl-prolyl cis-trans isomerase
MADNRTDPFALPPLDAAEWQDRPNGMKIWDATVGSGPEVKPGGEVTIHYTGWTTDGKVFDSSKKRGQPITFPLNRLIQGWQEGVPGMKPGGIRRLVIPYQLGYGERGSPPDIPPRIFEIELISSR